MAGYQLGVDLGTTYTAAAVCRDGRAAIVDLGSRSATVPSVVFLGEDGRLLVGDAALRRGLAQPDRLVREFKRRFGDPVPLMVAGSPMAADVLMAKLLEWVLAAVGEREGAPPDRVAVTHPANWGPYKRDLFAQAVRLAGIDGAVLLSEPEAAARCYISGERLDPGQALAVYDLGGGTFDAAVLRRTDDGFELLGRPEGIDRLGGVDFDEAVLEHVRRAVGPALAAVEETDDPAVGAALTRLRVECGQAKEALSADTDAVVQVVLPGVQTQVRLTRSEFEDLIRPTLEPTLDVLVRTIATANIDANDLATVLLVGGSSRIPLVPVTVAERLGRPVAVDAHPKNAVALGAALAAGGQAAAGAPPAAMAPVPAGPVRPVPLTPVAPPSRRRAPRGRPLVAAFGAVAVIALVVLGAIFWPRLLDRLTEASAATATALEVFLDAARAPGPDPFTPDVVVGSPPDVPSQPPPVPDGRVSGDLPGLYGGTRDERVCDKDQLVGFLLSEPAKAAAWAGVLGVAQSTIPEYVGGLTPVLLRSDTMVTNHGFRDGRPTPRQAVLQAGTAVLVDSLAGPG